MDAKDIFSDIFERYEEWFEYVDVSRSDDLLIDILVKELIETKKKLKSAMLVRHD